MSEEHAADSHYTAFFHVNDVHAHLDEFSSSGTDCEEPEEGCYGGYARIKSKVTELRKAHPDNLWLNAGDEFQGTLFYSFYGPEKIAITVNDLKFDVMTLGNHEWDGGDDQLGRFLDNLTFPVVSANVKSEHKLLKKHIKPYHVFEDKNLAVIGATTEETPSISDVGEKTKFLDPIESVQNAVKEIREKHKDVKYIVLLSHLGYDVDQELAEKSDGISLIIGGHSHTLLGDMEDAEGKYPTIVENSKGDEVFVVTSYRWGEYLGSINLLYDEQGRIMGYRGKPIHLTNETSQDKELQAKIESWRGPFEEFAAEVLGSTDADLVQETCQEGDCLLGQVMADAMLEYRQNQTTNKDEAPDFTLLNAGGVRAEIPEGNITRGQVLTSFPFGNAVVELKYTGEEVRVILEGAVSMVNQNNGEEVGSWFQVSRGIKIEYNPDAEEGSRLVSVEVGGEPLDDDRDYRIVTLDFLAGGGDNILEETKDFATLDLQDEVLVQYVQAHSPMSPKLEERVVKTDKRPEEAQEEGQEEGQEGGSEEGSEEGGDNDDAAAALAAPVWAAALVVGVAMVAM
jgi:5'-nucleotidase